MSATYRPHLSGRRPHVQPAEARRPSATRLELIAAWKERHGQLDMYRLSGVSKVPARTSDA